MVVYKYEIVGNRHVMNLPTSARVLKVAAQGESIQLWALVNPADKSTARRAFAVFGTGQEITEYQREVMTYIDTVFVGSLVWHVFEEVIIK